MEKVASLKIRMFAGEKTPAKASFLLTLMKKCNTNKGGKIFTMIKNNISILIFLFFTPSYLFPQQISFQKTYDFGYSDRGTCVKQTQDSGYVVAGWQGIGFSTANIIVMKTDKYGTMQWSDIIGNDERYANYVTNCSSGGYAVVGFIPIVRDSVSSEDIYVIRLNNNGDTVWTRHYGTPSLESGTCIQETLNHDFVISFASHDTSGILKIDSVGNVLWWKRYFIYNGVSFNNIFELPTGDYILSGSTAKGTPNLSQGAIMRTDSNGDSLWFRDYGGIGEDQFYEAQKTLDGNIIVAGISAPNVSSTYDSYVLKLDLNGDTIWTKRFGTQNDGCLSISVCSDGGYIVGGTIYYPTNSDMFITKLNAYGDSLWTKDFGDSTGSIGYFVRQTNDKGYILVGESGAGDVYLVKTDSTGNAILSINELGSQSFSFNAYPNPATTTLNLTISNEEGIKNVRIYNLLGECLLHQQLTTNNQQVTLDVSSYAKGVYFVEVQTEEGIMRKKIIKE